MSGLTIAGVSAYRQMSLRTQIDTEVMVKAKEATKLQGEGALQLLQAAVQSMPPVIPGQPGRLINFVG